MKDFIVSNITYPTWFLLIYPKYLIITIPLIFVIVSVMLLISLLITKQGNILKSYSKSILRVFGITFLSYLIGSLFLIIVSFLPISSKWYEDVISSIMYNPFSNIFSFIVVAISILGSGILIYIFNTKIGLKKLELEDRSKKNIAILLGVLLAPYIFLYPTKLAYEDTNQIGSDVEEYIETNKDITLSSEEAKSLFSNSIEYTKLQYTKVLNNVQEYVVLDENEFVVSFTTSNDLISNNDYYASYLNSMKQTAAIMFSTCSELKIVSIVNSYLNNEGKIMTKDVLIKRDELENEYKINFSDMKNNSTKLQEIINNTENVKIYE